MDFLPRHTIDDVRVVTRTGPWDSKSGGALEVLLALPQAEVQTFLDYDSEEFARAEEVSGENIRGLRAYTVSDIPQGSIGGKEWHRARTEYVTALAGTALWECIDFDGRTAEFVLDGETAVITPPGILHTYTALENDTRLQVVCNTLFTPDNPATHDTFNRDSFYETRAEKLRDH